MEIPFNRPYLSGSEFEYIQQALNDHLHLAGNGHFTRQSQAYLEEILNVPRVLLTTSCTDSLEMAALLLRLQPGDEVIVPSFTFVSTANAFALYGAKPVFVDIRPDTLNLDETKVEEVITERTRAIIPVHYAGVGCEMDALREIAQRHGLLLIEDNAHGLFAKYKGQLLGTIGDLASLSFHETKNIICGEGGALIINSPDYIERAEILRDKGTNRSRFFRGEVDRYTWVDLGSSFLPSDILAAFLYSQLERHEAIQGMRKNIWNFYATHLVDWAQSCGIRLPYVPDYCEQSYHMFYILLPSLEERSRLIQHLGDHGILAVFHYVPLHQSEMGQKFGAAPDSCPVTTQVSETLLRLPFYNALSDAELNYVVETLQKFS